MPIRRLRMKTPVLGITPSRGFLIGIIGNTIQMLGTYWDLYWHIYIGRESFWIPPHEVVLVGWAIVFLGNGFGFLADRARQKLQGKWRFPLGYLMIGVGLVGMLIAAYLDDQRHQLLARTGGTDSIITTTHLFLFGSGFVVGLGMMFGLARELHLKGIWPREDGGRLYPLRKATAEEAGLLLQFADWIMIMTLLAWGWTDRPWSTSDWFAALLSTGIYSLVIATSMLTLRRTGTATIVAVLFSVMRAPYQWPSFYYPFLILAAVLLDVLALRFKLTNSVLKTAVATAFLMGPFMQSFYLLYAAVLRGFVWTPQFELTVIVVTFTVGAVASLTGRPLSAIVRSVKI